MPFLYIYNCALVSPSLNLSCSGGGRSQLAANNPIPTRLAKIHQALDHVLALEFSKIVGTTRLVIFIVKYIQHFLLKYISIQVAVVINIFPQPSHNFKKLLAKTWLLSTDESIVTKNMALGDSLFQISGCFLFDRH